MRKRTPQIIVGSAGFTSEPFDPESPPNAIITGSRQYWFNDSGELQVMGGLLPAVPQITGDVAFLFGDGIATLGTGSNEARGNVAKYVGGAAIITSNANVSIYDPSISPSVVTLAKTWTDFIPQIAPRDVNSTVRPYRNAVTIGVDQPTTVPELIQPDNTPGKNLGLYSVKMSYVRGFTGEESLTSDAAAPLQLNNSKVIFRFPDPPVTRYVDNSTLVFDTNDYWIVYTTPRDYGATPVFRRLSPYNRVFERNICVETYTSATWSIIGNNLTLTTATVNGVSGITAFTQIFTAAELATFIVGKTVTDGVNSYTITAVPATNTITLSAPPVFVGTTLTIHQAQPGLSADRYLLAEWAESDLETVVPPDDLFVPATQALFAVPLNNVLVLVGTSDDPLGSTSSFTGVACSQQNFFHAFPPSFRFNLPETPVGVSYRAEDGFFYVLCQNSLHEIRWTGATFGAPVALRTLSTATGVGGAKTFFMQDGTLYYMTPASRLTRLTADGAFDSSFSDPVQELVKDWNPEIVSIAFDSLNKCIAFFHEEVMLCYYPDKNRWGSPVYLDEYNYVSPDFEGTVNNAITYKGLIHVFESSTEYNFGTSQPILPASPLGIQLDFIRGTLPAPFNISGFGAAQVGIDCVLDFGGGNVLYKQTTDAYNVGLFISILEFDRTDPDLLARIGQTCTVTVFQPTETWTVDRDLLGNEANLQTNAFLRLQWNSFDSEILGKTVMSAVFNGTYQGTSTSNTMFFYGDFDTVNPLTGCPAPGYPVTFLSSNRFSEIVDTNCGIARLISTELRTVNAQRSVFSLLRLETCATSIPGNF